MKINQSVIKSVLVLLLMTGVDVALAATANANIAVSATITQNCTISATPIAFGAYDPVSGGNVTASGTVVVACTKGATSTYVGLGNGSNYSGSSRYMDGGVAHDKLAYTLVQPVSATPLAACPAYGANTAWGSTSAHLQSLERRQAKLQEHLTFAVKLLLVRMFLWTLIPTLSLLPSTFNSLQFHPMWIEV